MSDDFITKAINKSIGMGEIGVQIAVYHKGKLVVDAVGGTVSLAGPPVTSDTIFPAASVGKAATGMTIHRMVQQGIFGYDDLVGSVWPEFATKGKEEVTIRHALTHSAGIPLNPPGWSHKNEGDLEWVANALANSEAMYPPGTKNAYHWHTWGFILAEIGRRANPKGRDFPQIMQEEVCQPAGIDSLWCQMPPEEYPRLAWYSGHRTRVAAMPPMVVTEDDPRNKPGWWDVLNPSACVMTAKSGARLFSIYAHGGEVDGVRMFPEDLVRSFLRPNPMQKRSTLSWAARS